MSSPDIKINVVSKPIIKGKMDVRFPARVEALSPILLDKAGGNFTFSLDVNDLLPMLSGDYLSRAELNYVPDRGSLASRSLSSSEIFIMSDTSEPPLWVPASGDQSAFIAAGDPRFVAPSSDPTGASGAFVAVGTIQTSQFYQENGARVHRLADRVFMGGAVQANGQQVAAQGDWLTTWQRNHGAGSGYVQTSTSAILMTGNSDNELEALTVGAQTLGTITGGNAIGVSSFGIGNKSGDAVHGYAFYGEGHRGAGSIGGAYGIEVNTVNFNSPTGIDPFTQQAAQTIGVQIASGGDVYSGLFNDSAAINIRSNGAKFITGIVFGNDAINGTDGSSGEGEAIALSTGHTINYYYGSGLISWQMRAVTGGVNADYIITTNGSGSVSVPSIKIAGTKVSAVDADGTLAANSDTRVATQKATKTYIDQIIAAQDAMVFKGVIDCSANPNYPAADRGWTYRVSVAGKIGGAAGVNVEAGDLLLCLTDGTASGNQATVGSSWTIAQANLDGAVIGPASATSGNIATFNGTTGKLIQDGGKALPTGAIVGTTDSQTLTNKSISGGSVENAPVGAATPNTGKFTTLNATTDIQFNGASITGAWTSYSPTLSVLSGSLASATATGKYIRVGKTVFFTISITIATNGTAAGSLGATLPTTPNTNGAGSGRENGVSGKMLQVQVVSASNVANIFNYDNTYPGLSGASITVSGVYESQ